MANVSAVQVTFGTQVVGPGLTKLWFQELLDATSRQAAVDSVAALLTGFATLYMRTDFTMTVQQKIQNFDLTTGKLTSEVNAGTQPAPIVGSIANTIGYTHGVGVRIIWSTGVVINGRKVIGRTFAVPLVSFTAATGAVLPALISSMATRITTYVTQPSARPVVWHKTFDRSDTSKPPVYVGGNAVPINGGAVHPEASSLRSRRY